MRKSVAIGVSAAVLVGLLVVTVAMLGLVKAIAGGPFKATAVRTVAAEP